MSAVKTLTRLWLQHVVECEPCEVAWTGGEGAACQRGRGLDIQLEHALDRDMPAEEGEAIRPESQ